MSDAKTMRGLHAPAGAAAARRALIQWVREGGEQGRVFLQVYIEALGDRFSLCHVDDRARAGSDLASFTDPFAARAIAQTTAAGAHRPLKTAPNLRAGWRFDDLDERGLWTALDYLYPAAVPHWHAGREGSLRVTHWAETASRQSGMYSVVRLLPDAAVRDTVRACCADSVCLRRVEWGMSPADPAPIDSEGNSSDLPAGRTPCPEACSIFISFARAILEVERSPRTPVEGLGMLNEPEREQIRELVEAEVGMRGRDVREGEFDLPLNERRLRYLAVRMGRETGGSEAGSGSDE